MFRFFHGHQAPHSFSDWKGYAAQLVLITSRKRRLVQYACGRFGCTFQFATPDAVVRDLIAIKIHPQFCKSERMEAQVNVRYR